jgi:hypothetical protein
MVPCIIMRHRGARLVRGMADDLVSASIYKSLTCADVPSSSNAYLRGRRRVSDIASFWPCLHSLYLPQRLSPKHLCGLESLGGEAEPSPPYGICPGKPSTQPLLPHCRRYGAASPASLCAPSGTLASPSRCRYLRRYPRSLGCPLRAAGGFSPRSRKRHCIVPPKPTSRLGGPPARRRDDSAGRHECTAERYRMKAPQ